MDVYNVQSIKVFAGVPLPFSSRLSCFSARAQNPLPLDLFERLLKETGELNCSITLYSQNLVVFTDEIHEKKIKTKQTKPKTRKQQQQQQQKNNKVDNKLT